MPVCGGAVEPRTLRFYSALLPRVTWMTDYLCVRIPTPVPKGQPTAGPQASGKARTRAVWENMKRIWR